MNSPFRIPTKVRIAFSKLGSLLLLFQKTPLVQMLLPEARVLGTSGVGEVVNWSVAAIAGLGAFDTVAGATVIAQVSPSPNSTTVPATDRHRTCPSWSRSPAPRVPRPAAGRSSARFPPASSMRTRSTAPPTRSPAFPPRPAASRSPSKHGRTPGYGGGAKSQAFTIVVTGGGGGTVTAPAITSQPGLHHHQQRRHHHPDRRRLRHLADLPVVSRELRHHHQPGLRRHLAPASPRRP